MARDVICLVKQRDLQMTLQWAQGTSW